MERYGNENPGAFQPTRPLRGATRPVKPLIYQQRKKAKFVSKTNETDDNVFMSKKFIYGADSRGNAGFGFWQMAYGSDGTTT